MKTMTLHANSSVPPGNDAKSPATPFGAHRHRAGMWATVFGLLALSTLCATADTVGFTADPAGPFGGAGNNGGLNIGHTFTVTGSGIQVLSLGVYDYQGNGLISSHTVTLFSDSGAVHTTVSGGSISVPAGTAGALKNGFRFAALPV